MLPQLEELMKIDGNDCCLECESRKVEWASVNLGIFVCEACSVRHRSLGRHVSEIRSLSLDTWSVSDILQLKKNGNKKSKNYYEKSVPSFQVRPPVDRGPIAMEYWLREKYEFKRFVIENDSDEKTNWFSAGMYALDCMSWIL